MKPDFRRYRVANPMVTLVSSIRNSIIKFLIFGLQFLLLTGIKRAPFLEMNDRMKQRMVTNFLDSEQKSAALLL